MNYFAQIKPNIAQPKPSLLIVFGLLISYSLYSLTQSPSLDLLNDPAFLKSWIDDRSLRGRSQASLYHENNMLVLECKLEESSYQWPFCGLRLSWDSRNQGIEFLDAGEFDYLQISLGYRELPKVEASVRLHLNAQLPMSAGGQIKHQELTIPANHQTQAIDLHSFEIPIWWLREHQDLSASYKKLQLSAIRRIQIYTGQELNKGTYHLEIEELKMVKHSRLQAWQGAILTLAYWLLVGYSLRDGSRLASNNRREPDWESLCQSQTAQQRPLGILLLSSNHNQIEYYRPWLPANHEAHQDTQGLMILLAGHSIEQTELIARKLLVREPMLCIGVSNCADNESLQAGYHRAIQALSSAIALGPNHVIIAQQT